MPDVLVTALIVLVALVGVVVLLAGVWSLWADWTLERRERARPLADVIPFPSGEQDAA